jgi:hypothetical protein
MSNTDPALVADESVIGEGQSHNLSPSAPYGQAIPYHVAATLAARSGAPVPVFTPAIGGTSWTVLATTFVARLLPYLPSSARPKIILNGGTQDVIDGDTAATVYADMLAHARRIRLNSPAGAILIGCTIPPVDAANPLTFGAWTAPREAVRVAANVLIAANADGGWDAVADLAAVLPDPTDAESFQGAGDGTFAIDGLHLSDVGAAIGAVEVITAIDEAEG